MTSAENAEERLGRTKVTPIFFKKLGKKLRNHQKYQKPEQLSDQNASNIQSFPLDLSSGVKASSEQNDEKYSAEGRKTRGIRELSGEDVENEQGSKDDGKMINQTKLERMEQKSKKRSNSMSLEHFSREQHNISELLDEGYRPVHSNSSTDITNESQNITASNRESDSTSTASSVTPMDVNTKPVNKFHEGLKRDFNLGNSNTLSILKFKNNQNAVIYELKNSSGRKIHLEKMDNRVMLLSVDENGKCLRISCNF